MSANPMDPGSTETHAKNRMFGRFLCQEKLDGAAPFELWRARTHGLAGFDRAFAVKALNNAQSGLRPDASQRLLEFASRATAIKDPHIAQVVDCGTLPDGTTYVVTEFVFGNNLGALVKLVRSGAPGDREQLPSSLPVLIAHIGAEIAAALCATHSIAPPLVHGALGPGNVIITSRGQVKVVDFGLRNAVIPTRGSGGRRILSEYAAPEMLLAGDGSIEGDVFALGAMLFELATGKSPPSARNPRSSTDLGRALSQIPETLTSAILSMVKPDPSARPSASELEQLLHGASGSLSETALRSELGALSRRLDFTDSRARDRENTTIPSPAESLRQRKLHPTPKATTPVPASEALPPLNPFEDASATKPPGFGEVPTRNILRDTFDSPSSRSRQQTEKPSTRFDPKPRAAAAPRAFPAPPPTRIPVPFGQPLMPANKKAEFDTAPTASGAGKGFDAAATAGKPKNLFDAERTAGEPKSRFSAERTGGAPKVITSDEKTALGERSDFHSQDTAGGVPTPATGSPAPLPRPAHAFAAPPAMPLVEVPTRPSKAEAGSMASAIKRHHFLTPVPSGKDVPLNRSTFDPKLGSIPGAAQDPAKTAELESPVFFDSPNTSSAVLLTADDMIEMEPSVRDAASVSQTDEGIPRVFPSRAPTPPPRGREAINMFGIEDGEVDALFAPGVQGAHAADQIAAATKAMASNRPVEDAFPAASAVDNAVHHLEFSDDPIAAIAHTHPSTTGAFDPDSIRLTTPSPTSEFVVRKSGRNKGLIATLATTALVATIGIMALSAPESEGVNPVAKPEAVAPVAIAPELAAAPEVAPPSEVAIAPELAAAPEVAPAPEVAAAPEVAIAPELAAAPEVAPAPEVAIAPTRAAVQAVSAGGAAQRNAAGELVFELTTDPPGAEIWVNGGSRGISPLSVNVRDRHKTLVLIRPGFQMMEIELDQAKLSVKETYKLVPVQEWSEGTATVSVECEKAGKYPILIDGKETGLLCPMQVQVPPGKHVVSIFVPWRFKQYPMPVDVAARKTVSVRYAK